MEEDTGSISVASALFPGPLWQPANHREVIYSFADFLKDDPAPVYPGVYYRAQGNSLSVYVR